MASVRKGGAEDEGSHGPTAVQPNRMAAAMERGGILGWGSYLTFAWAGPFLKLGSTVTLKAEHLEEIYRTFKRCVRVLLGSCLVSICVIRREHEPARSKTPRGRSTNLHFCVSCASSRFS